jgi:hypothetical protein
MLVGYTDENELTFCHECWHRQVIRGSSPRSVLEQEDSDDPDDNFWLVDVCAGCGKQVAYRDPRMPC